VFRSTRFHFNCAGRISGKEEFCFNPDFKTPGVKITPYRAASKPSL
jgi:hypothetical protein